MSNCQNNLSKNGNIKDFSLNFMFFYRIYQKFPTAKELKMNFCNFKMRLNTFYYSINENHIQFNAGGGSLSK